jgi:hypothetical protein
MGGLVFAGTDNGIYRSTNGGTSWVAVDSGLPALTLVHSMAVNGTNVFAGTHSRGVFLSSDSGARWVAVNTGLPAATSVYSLAANDGKVIAGTYAAGVYGSINGTTWTAANAGLPASALTNYVFCLAMCGTNLFAGIGHNIFSSADAGVSWTGAGSALIFSDVYCLAASGPNLFAGTYSDGVFLSKDNGATWAAANTGLPQGNQNMCLVVSGTDLFLGSGNHAVWRRPLSEMIAVINPKSYDKSNQHCDFRITVPSRSCRNAAIGFSLPNSEKVLIGIYNLSGSEIATIVNMRLGSGLHRLLWDTRTVASGCYTIRIEAGSRSYVKNIPLFQ